MGFTRLLCESVSPGFGVIRSRSQRRGDDNEADEKGEVYYIHILRPLTIPVAFSVLLAALLYYSIEPVVNFSVIPLLPNQHHSLNDTGSKLWPTRRASIGTTPPLLPYSGRSLSRGYQHRTGGRTSPIQCKFTLKKSEKALCYTFFTLNRAKQRPRSMCAANDEPQCRRLG